MTAGIFLIQNDKLVELSDEPFETEDVFQELLSSYPNLIAGDQVDANAPRRWLLVTREMGIPGEEGGSDRWSLDHLFLDQDGIPTLVEVKRSSDTRIRREVVGQMLDYAANAIVYWPVEEIRSQFASRCEADEKEPDAELAGFLDDDVDPDAFWSKVKTNLQAGKVRMLFVADVIPNELRRIVEFLNEQMDPAEVLALEIKRYAGSGLQTLVPRVLGQTAEAQRRKGSGQSASKPWDEASFFEAVKEQCDAQIEAAIQMIYDWAQKTCSISWGRGTINGSVQLSPKGQRANVFFIYSNGEGSFNVSTLKRLPPFDQPEAIDELRGRLNVIEGINFADDAFEGTWKSFRLQDLDQPTGAKTLMTVLSWLFEKLG